MSARQGVLPRFYFPGVDSVAATAFLTIPRMSLRAFEIEIDVQGERIEVQGRIPFSVPTDLVTWTKGLPPSKPKRYSELPDSNAEEHFYWRNTIIPELKLFADELNRSLVPLFGSRETLRVAFDISTIDALREFETQRVERVVSLVAAGILTMAEARGEGLKPL